MLYRPGSSSNLPREFIYGAGVSAVQTEKHPTTNLHHWTQNGHADESPLHYGNGVNFDTLYPQDLQRLKGLGMNTFRFSLFSHRILDEQCNFNDTGLDHYSRLIDEALRLEIIPVMTIQHFDPCGYQWHQDHAVDMFLGYASKVIDKYADRVRYITPINEPKVNASLPYMEGQIEVGKGLKAKIEAGNNMLTAIDNQAKAHKEVYKYAQHFQDPSNPLYIATSENIAYFEGYGNNWLNRSFAEMTDYFDTNYFLGQIAGYFDILGINYYWHRIFKAFGEKIQDEITTDTGARMSPHHLLDVLKKLAKFHRPILITEVGIADKEDRYRVWYLDEIINAIAEAKAQDIDVIGVLLWSLLDNFEMPPHGYKACYGAYAVDLKTQVRTLRPSIQKTTDKLRELGLIES